MNHFILIIIECIIIAVLAGLIYGIFGGGSGLIMTPGFYYILYHANLFPHHTMQASIATTATASAILGIFATRVYWRKAHIDFTAFKKIAPGLTVGTLTAVALLNVVPSYFLKHLFGVVVIIVAIWMVFYRQEKDQRQWHLFSYVNYLLSMIIGLLWFLLGVAVFTVPYLHKCGVDLRHAIGSASLTGTIFSALAGSFLMLTGVFQVGFSLTHIGFVSTLLLACSVLPSAIAAHWGSRLSTWLPKQYLKFIYSCLIALVGMLMII